MSLETVAVLNLLLRVILCEDSWTWRLNGRVDQNSTEVYGNPQTTKFWILESVDITSTEQSPNHGKKIIGRTAQV